MSFPATPESQDYMFQPQHVVNSAYTVRDWNALDNLYDWQRDQTNYTTPDSLITDFDQYHSQSKLDSFSAWQSPPTSNITISHTQQWTPLSTTAPFNTPPESVDMLEDNDLFHEDTFTDNASTSGYSTPRQDPGPQLPKIGRPRNTSSPSAVGETPGNGGKAPGQTRRRNQNRDAQRAFRARQRQYIEQLVIENKELVEKNAALGEKCHVLSEAYRKVLSENGRK